MSITNSILKLLNMKDKNINFDENYLEEITVNGKRSLIFRGYLDVDLKCCPQCGCIDNIIKNGTKTLKPVKIPSISGLTSYLKLTKQLYKCKNCNKKITPQTTEIGYRCRISNNTKYSITTYSKEAISYKFIAHIHNVSNMTVQRQNRKVFSNEKLYKNTLPKHLCIDEFTYKNRIMAFNFCDSITGKTIDLVEDRSLENLTKYFKHYLEDCRLNVKSVVMDMYKPYLTLIKECFPNAKIIIDLFHIVQLISRSMNKTRIQTMKHDKVNYRKMKRYWRLLLKSRLDLDCSKWKKYLCFKSLMTEVDIVDYILEHNTELKETYELYQNILYALQHRDYELFKNIINIEYKNISSYMQTSLNTLKQFSPYIQNTLELSYSNGVIERNNNTCKLIKRIAFGFRNFNNFKARIMIMTNLFRANKKEA